MVASHRAYSPMHEASLIDPSLHSPALMDMLEIEMSRPLIGVFFYFLFSLSTLLTYYPFRICCRLCGRDS